MVTAAMAVAAAAAVAVAIAVAMAAAAVTPLSNEESELFVGKEACCLPPLPRLYISELLQGAAILGEARPLPGSFPRKSPDRLTQNCVS